MERPRFSEMLVRRRRELGLSTAQAAQVLKIKEQVLVAFEEGDFDSIPKSGYAQGMLSSYARYLGLNARQLVDIFQEELYEFINGEQSHELRRRTRNVSSGRDLEGYETVNEAQSRPKAYVGAKGLLPTSGGPAGDYGEFATTSKASPRSGGSVPLVNSTRTTSLYATGSASTYGRGAAYDPNNTAAVGSHSQFVNGHSNNARDQRARQDGSRQQASPQTRRRRADSTRSRGDASAAYGDLRRENVRTRRASSNGREGTGHVQSYEPATSQEARRRSRSANAQAPARPNVRGGGQQRQGSRSSSERTRQGQRPRSVSGDRSRRSSRRTSVSAGSRGIGLILVLAVTVILTVVVIVSVQSCTSSRDAEQPTSVPVATTTTTGSVDVGSSSDSDESGSSDADAASEDAGSAASSDVADAETADNASDSTEESTSAAASTVELEVSVASGQQAWVEVTVDGVSQVADRYTGPWSATYTVSQSATVQADNTSAVSVTADGVAQTFSSKASGVGTVTVEAPQATAASDADAADATGTEGTATTSTTTTTTTGY